MFAVIHIPDFCLQAVLRHEPDLYLEAVALVDSNSTKPLILQCNAPAKNYAVGAGLTPTQAMARCGHLKIKPRSPAQEHSAGEILLQTASLFTPNIEATAPGICTMELKGLVLESGADRQSWAEKIRKALASFHLDCAVGLAPTPGLALLAARGAQPILIVENANEFIAQLPVAALEPPPETLGILSRWGIRHIGQLLALGRNNIGERLDAAGLILFERVSLDASRPLRLISPSETFSEQIEFENEIETAAPLLFMLRRFVEQLSRRLEMVYQVVAEFQLRLGLASGAAHEREFKIPSPTGNIDMLFRVLQTHLETVRTDTPIISLQLTAKPARPERHQFGLFESTLRHPNRFAETLARLGAMLGPENVGAPVLEKTHKPDSFRLQPPNFDEIPAAALFRGKEGEMRGVKISNIGLSLRRLRPPSPAHLEFRDEKPVLLRSEIFTGAIIGMRGPFLSSGQWWDDARWAREEWDVETSNGSLLRVFRTSTSCFVEGVYD
jgi:protein ImuB